MAINTSKVVVGGLVAGAVANVLGFLLFGLWLGPRFQAEAAAVAPSLAQAMTGTATAATVVTTFIIGWLLVWLYAAMRPRFGPGPKTAMAAAIVVWILGFIFHLESLFSGMVTGSTYALASVAAAIQVGVAAWVGAMMYKEEGTGAPA
jgi:hypothetical protein